MNRAREDVWGHSVLSTYIVALMDREPFCEHLLHPEEDRPVRLEGWAARSRICRPSFETALCAASGWGRCRAFLRRDVQPRLSSACWVDDTSWAEQRGASGLGRWTSPQADL